MSLKNAAFLALMGTLLLTILLAADFIKTVSGVLNDVVPATALLRSLVYLLASLKCDGVLLRLQEGAVSMIGCWKQATVAG